MNLDPINHYYNVERTDYGVNSLRRRKILNLAAHCSTQRVLDIGCATGYLGQELKTPNNKVIGVDLAKASVVEAGKILDEAYVMDVERDPWPNEISREKFDLIVCAEILEHLFDQDAFLQKLKSILSPTGSVILSTPNFLIWNNRRRILLGRFGPKEIFFDRGHISLLSYEGLLAKVQSNGYRLLEEDNVWYPNYLEPWRRILSPNLFVFQAVIRITPVS